MQQVFENALTMTLARVLTHGTAEITNEELKLWYGNAQRISVGIWRDIADRWEVLQSDPPIKLLVGRGDGLLTFVWGEGLSTSEDSWLKDVRYLAGRTDSTGVEISLV